LKKGTFSFSGFIITEKTRPEKVDVPFFNGLLGQAVHFGRGMMNQNLTDLLEKKKKQSAGASAVDWDDRRDKYLAAVQSLYRQIEEMLAEPIRQKSVTLQRRTKQLTESFIGTYAADDLILVIGNEQVRFSPRGRNIGGATGRVDVLGERGETMLLLQPDSKWAVVQTRQPSLRTAPLDESTFTELLRLVMRD
jgi:hypothetical protein